LHDAIEQLPARHHLHHEIVHLILLVKVVHVDDVGVLHLPQYTDFIPQRIHLVGGQVRPPDALHSNHVPGGAGLGLLHDGEGAGTEVAAHLVVGEEPALACWDELFQE